MWGNPENIPVTNNMHICHPLTMSVVLTHPTGRPTPPRYKPITKGLELIIILGGRGKFGGG